MPTKAKVISRKTTDLDTDYKWGFVTEIESDLAPKGLNEEIIRLIVAKKNEPEWMLEW
ncbi:MAG: Fe-S cluster assembly protein SufB, partial [Dehalococcoidia bacterium]